MARTADFPTLTPHNRIYLYHLLARELGCGRQTFLPRVEEVLASDRMTAADLGFESTRSLLEALDEFIELTIFKGGRIYATVIAQSAWDDALAAWESGKAPGANGDPASNKPWKRKKADKQLKPVRPKRLKRPEAPAEAPAVSRNEAPAKTPAVSQNEAPAEVPAPAAVPETLAVSQNEAPAATPAFTSGERAEGLAPVKAPAPAAVPETLAAYPQDFTEEVYLSSKVVTKLCELLPYGIDALSLLAEDYTRARALGLVGGTRAQATFPLRIQHAQSTDPIKVELKRRTRAGLKWELADVE